MARGGRARPVARRRGRSATRTLSAPPHLNAPLPRYSACPRRAPVAGLRATPQPRRGTPRAVRVLLTSLPPQPATPARLLALARGPCTGPSRAAPSSVMSPAVRSAQPGAPATRRSAWRPTHPGPYAPPALGGARHRRRAPLLLLPPYPGVPAPARCPLRIHRPCRQRAMSRSTASRLLYWG